MIFLVIIPTYNEVENIGAMLDEVMSVGSQFHVLVVDDNSTDGTKEEVAKKQSLHKGRIFIEHRPAKMGLGSAYVYGFDWALKRDYSYIAEMDADFSHPVDKLLIFYKVLSEGKFDVVVGSRYVAGGQIVNWSIWRKLLSKLGSIYTQLLTGLKVKDTTAGFIAYKRQVLERINFNHLPAQGYVFQIEVKLAAWVLGFKISEIPICFVDRILGTSKMNSSIIKEAMWRVIKVAFDLHFGSYKHKVTKK